MPSNRLWITLGLLSLLASVILIAGFGLAAKDLLFPTASVQEQPVPEPSTETSIVDDSSEIRIAAIGDSLTKGTGDPTGDGYVRQLVNSLKEEKKKPVTLLNNLAINGLRADQLADKLKSENGLQQALKQANLIVLTIGGNDLFQFALNSRTPGEPGIHMSELRDDLSIGLERLDDVFAELNRINPQAQIVYVGLYNPFFDLEELKDGSLEVQEWNRQAYEMLHKYPTMMMVPTFDLFENRIGQYLSSDHFHPNHEGYQAIAARMLQSL